MPVEHRYGTFRQENPSNRMPDVERILSRGKASPSPPGGTNVKNAAMESMTDPAMEQASIVFEESQDYAQAGVKRLEAISSTWTKTGLYVAYLGSVQFRYKMQGS